MVTVFAIHPLHWSIQYLQRYVFLYLLKKKYFLESEEYEALSIWEAIANGSYK